MFTRKNDSIVSSMEKVESPTRMFSWRVRVPSNSTRYQAKSIRWRDASRKYPSTRRTSSSCGMPRSWFALIVVPSPERWESMRSSTSLSRTKNPATRRLNRSG